MQASDVLRCTERLQRHRIRDIFTGQRRHYLLCLLAAADGTVAAAVADGAGPGGEILALTDDLVSVEQTSLTPAKEKGL